MTEKMNHAKLSGILIAIVWSIALYAAAQPAAMGSVSSDNQTVLLEDEIAGEFDSPIAISAGFQASLQIGLVLRGTVTFTGSTGDAQILTIDALPGANVSSEHTMNLDQVGSYSIAEQLTLGVETNNPLLDPFFSSLTWEGTFDWEYENENAGEKVYKLSSSISDLLIQLSGDLEASLETPDPKDQESVIITIPQEIQGGSTVRYVIKHSAKWTKESSVGSTYIDIPSNHPPVLNPIPDKEVELGQELQIVLSATDADEGDVLTYSATGDPMSMGAQMDGNIFTWQPTDDAQVGDYEVTFIVEDSANESDRQDAKISVRSVDEPDEPGKERGKLVRSAKGGSKQDKGRGKPDKIDVHIRKSRATLSLKGNLPSLPAFDTPALLDAISELELSGNVGDIDAKAALTLVDHELDESGDSGLLVFDVSLEIGDVVIGDDSVSCEFSIQRRRNLFKFYADGQSDVLGEIDLRITGIISGQIVETPTVNLGAEYVSDVLSEIAPLSFLSAIPDFPIDSIPEEITIEGSFEGIGFAITLSLGELVTKSQKNRTAISFVADLALDMDSVQVDIPLKCKFELKSKHDIFSIDVSGKGTGVQKVDLSIGGRITEDGIVTQPIVKLMIIFRPGELVDQNDTLASSDNTGDDGEKKPKDDEKNPKDNEKKPKSGKNMADQPLLLQNFPNPFNPETWIPYQLHKTCHVNIKIYDVPGRLMRTLDLGYRDAGIYASKTDAAYWDGRNDAGEEVVSGLYFYTIQAGDFMATRRMLILK